jgi:hypothetical protein
MTVSLRVESNEVQGELTILIAPGTVADNRDRLVDEALTEPLFEFARQNGVVLVADPHAYVRALDGRDEQGNTRFLIQGTMEGDRLIPIGRGRRRARG